MEYYPEIFSHAFNFFGILEEMRDHLSRLILLTYLKSNQCWDECWANHFCQGDHYLANVLIEYHIGLQAKNEIIYPVAVSQMGLFSMTGYESMSNENDDLKKSFNPSSSG